MFYNFYVFCMLADAEAKAELLQSWVNRLEDEQSVTINVGQSWIREYEILEPGKHRFLLPGGGLPV